MTKDASKKSYSEREKEQNDAINAELDEWHKEGIDPANLSVNQFIFDNQFRALLRLLIEDKIIDEDRFNEEYRTGLLKNLQYHREKITSAVRKSTILQGIELPPGVIDARNGKVE